MRPLASCRVTGLEVPAERRHVWLLGQSRHVENIVLLLSLQTVHIKVLRIRYPSHWRATTQTPASEKTIGSEFKRHRLSLHLLQSDVAKRLGVHVVSISNWERGVSQPSRAMRRKIRVFLDTAHGNPAWPACTARGVN